MPLIIPSNSISGEFEVANSLRFAIGSSDYLNRTPSSAGNRKTFTWSFWVKRSDLASSRSLYSVDTASGTTGFSASYFTSTGELFIGVRESSGEKRLKTNQVFRDVSAWYHIVIAFDTTQSTGTDRIKLYVNGSQVTSFAEQNDITQNFDTSVNNTVTQDIGVYKNSGGSRNSNFDGYMAEVCLIDGQQLTPTSFGEFDEDTNIWKPIDVSGLTFGTNGFYLDFENSGSLGADVSGNGNNFTVNNLTSIDQTTDTPTNNYDTANPLIANGNVTYAEGNLQTSHTYASQWRWTTSTIGVDTGKWYAEFKVSAVGSETAIGIMPEDAINGNQNSGNDFVGKFTDSVAYLYNGQIYKSNSIDNTTSTYTTNDIIGIALDLDSNSIQFYKNGSSVGSAVSLTANKNYFFGCAGYNTAIILWNFGNPPFTISSGNSDGNSRGNFEYPVPSGYFALCTSNLAEHG